MFVVHFICIVGAWSSTKVLAANQDYMKNIISNYFSQPRHHEADLDYKNRSRDLIFSEFKRLGLETTVQNFSQEKVTFSNVIGVSRGFRIGKKDDKIVAVGAHYDTTQNSSGVDDNGSGMAAMFEVARQIDEHRQKGEQINNTVIFMAFDLEEGEGNLMFLDHVVDVIGKTVFNLSEIHMPAAENDGMGTHPSSAPRAVSTMVLVHAMMLLIYD
ncbi:hypothetical protein MAR_005995 [Mya arenaria]|uniref:Peptidase M28 domain-containing protein n=1 Tax=Mya arenaria TaxID=6604 RepID=A0ABY7D772_MYAAR|nr:hypothetical protein MAR_005995 [Mya arenaria]